MVLRQDKSLDTDFPDASESAHLMEEMIDYDSYGIGEVQTAHSTPYGNAIAWVNSAHFIRQAGRFPAEEQIIPVIDARFGIIRNGVTAEANDLGESLGI